jgi:hypothetical protein
VIYQSRKLLEKMVAFHKPHSGSHLGTPTDHFIKSSRHIQGGDPMSGIQSQQQLENTKEKLQQLEEHYQRRKEEPAENTYARKLSLQSLKRTINQLKEEIARFEGHARMKS